MKRPNRPARSRTGITGFLIALSLTAVMFWGWYACNQEKSKFRDCQAPLESRNRFADPITGTCGVRQGRKLFPGTREACANILQELYFRPIRHCWDGKLPDLGK